MKPKQGKETNERSDKKGQGGSARTGKIREAGAGGPDAEVEEMEGLKLEDLDLENLDLQELDPEGMAGLLMEAKREVEERTDQLLRCRAELENTAKRAAREKEALSRYASEKIITKLLPVIDSLDQAAKHVEGMEKIRQQLLAVLRTEGLEPMDARGEKFDPYRHEALMMVESDQHEEGTVTEEVLRGYTLNSRPIRFSKVLVSKKR